MKKNQELNMHRMQSSLCLQKHAEQAQADSCYYKKPFTVEYETRNFQAEFP